MFKFWNRIFCLDIIVSSISSDEEEPNEPLQAPAVGSIKKSGDRCSSYPTSGETRSFSLKFIFTFTFSSACSTASPSPRILRPDYFFSMEVSPTSTAPFDYSTAGGNTAENRSPVPTNEDFNGHRPLQAMDTLKPPNFHLSPNFQNNLLSPNDAISSPPRSNSVDLSILRKDIELWSISSGDQSEIGSESEYEPITPAESIRTLRSKSHDPTHEASYFGHGQTLPYECTHLIALSKPEEGF